MTLQPFPRGLQALDAALLAAAYRTVRDELAVDPLFIVDADQFDVSLAELDRRMATPATTPDRLWNWLQGADQYRYAGLKVLVAAFGAGEPVVDVAHGAEVPGGNRIIAGDVHVHGDLVIGEQAMVVVLGT